MGGGALDGRAAARRHGQGCMQVTDRNWQVESQTQVEGTRLGEGDAVLELMAACTKRTAVGCRVKARQQGLMT